MLTNVDSILIACLTYIIKKIKLNKVTLIFINQNIKQ